MDKVKKKFPEMMKEKALQYSSLHEKNEQTQLNTLHLTMQHYENIIESMNAGIWEWNITTGEIAINELAAKIMGYQLTELLPLTKQSFATYCHPEDFEVIKENIELVFNRHKQQFHLECRLWHKDQYWIWVDICGEVFNWSNDDKPVIMFGFYFDITKMKERELMLEENEKLNHLIMSQMQQGLAVHEIICDETGKPIDYKYLLVNPRFEEQIGLKESEIIGKRVLELLPETEPYWIELFGKVALTGEPIQFEQYAQQLNKWFSIMAYSPKPMQFAVISTDITALKLANEEIIEKNKFINRFFSINMDLFCILDMDGHFLKVNEACENLFGDTVQVIEQRRIRDYMHPDDIEPVLQMKLQLYKQQKVYDFVIRMRTGSGTYRYLEWRFQPYGDVIYAAARDITERIEREKEVEYLSIHDHLTGLYNRRYMDQILGELLQVDNLPITLFSVDINGLKVTNDTYGHEMGDKLIKKVATILQESCPHTATLCRIGGDEFIIIARNTSDETAKLLKQKIVRNMREAKLIPLKVSVAIGYAVMSDLSQLFDDLMREADQNMYTNKKLYGKARE